jgi:hypothetical protein
MKAEPAQKVAASIGKLVWPVVDLRVHPVLRLILSGLGCR